MNILLSISHLICGGAQTFITELSNEFYRRQHKIFVFDYQYLGNRPDTSVIDRFRKNIQIVRLPSNIFKIWRMVFKQFCNGSYNNFLLDFLRFFKFRSLLRHVRVDIVNTHLYHSDNFITSALRKSRIPIIMTDHGDYRYVESQGITDRANLVRIMKRIDGLIYITDANIQSLSQYCKPDRTRQVKIYNGISRPVDVISRKVDRRSLGISSEAIVFGMVARGIPEKGWSEVIKAFQLMLSKTCKDIRLILVGSGPYLNKLKDSLPPQLRNLVHFTGFASQPENWIRCFNVGLLPSYFPGESLPSAVMEYLACGKPVIATDIGEIKKMLKTPDDFSAGTLIDLDINGKPNIHKLADEMLTYINNPAYLLEKTSLAQSAYYKFDIKRCADAYESFFKDTHNKMKSITSSPRKQRIENSPIH